MQTTDRITMLVVLCYLLLSQVFIKGSESSVQKLQPCVISEQEVRLRQMCDGTFDCQDLSDECLCTRKRLENAATYAICRKLLGTTEQPSNLSCRPGNISCHVNRDGEKEYFECIDGKRICDGKYDCVDGSDERYCGRYLNRTAIYSTVLGNNKTFGETMASNVSKNLNTSNERYACNGVVELTNGSDEMNCDQYYYCDENNTDALQRLYRMQIKGDLHDVERNKVFINWRQRFDGVGDCADLRDEWHTELYHSFIKASTPAAFESQRYIESPEYALRNRIFAAAEWIIGILTVIANTIVAVTTVRYIRKRRKRFTGTKMLNKVMVLSLCISDLLLGIVVTSVAVSDAMLSLNKEYWKRDLDWRSSMICNMIGVVTTSAAQISAFTLCLISTVRLYTIYRPFVIPTIATVVKWVFIVWLVGISLSIPPIIPISSFNDEFISAAHLPNLPQLENSVLDKASVADLMQNISVLHDLPTTSYCCDATRNFSTMGWYELERYLEAVNPKFGGWKYFRIYSYTSTCFQTSIQTPGRTYGWKHTITIFVIDSFTYLIVLMSYIFICKRTKNRFGASVLPSVVDNLIVTRKKPSNDFARNKEDMKMQKKIIFLTSTNIICWMPMCIQAFVQYSVTSADLVTSTSLLFTFALAEINSLINPFLYSKRLQTILSTIVFFFPRIILSKSARK